MPQAQALHQQPPRYRDARVGGCVQAQVLSGADGTTLIRSTEPLGDYPARLTDRLEHWAGLAPDRILVARRSPGIQGWTTLTYAQMLQRARAVGQALVNLGLSADRPVAILSENSLEHLTLALGAMWVGVPYAPISTAYSLVSKDYGKLRHIIQTITPGLIFASDETYAPAIAATAPAKATLVMTQGQVPGRQVASFDSL